MDPTTTLAAHEVGEGPMPVLIIHGWQISGEAEMHDFEPIFTKEPAASQLRRVYIDLPGMGATPANGVRDLNDMYNRLVEFIDSRFGKERFLLIGSSCGGYLARALAQKYNGQVDGLLLRVPLVEPKDSRRDLDKFEPVVADEQFMSRLSAEDKALLGDVLIQTPAYVDALRAKIKYVWTPAVEASDNKVLDEIRADPERYLLPESLHSERAKFLAPTLIVCGRQDESVGYRDSLRLLEWYPRSSFVVLDCASHGLPVGDTSIFDALVTDWIVRVGDWRNWTRR